MHIDNSLSGDRDDVVLDDLVEPVDHYAVKVRGFKTRRNIRSVDVRRLDIWDAQALTLLGNREALAGGSGERGPQPVEACIGKVEDERVRQVHHKSET